MWSISLPDRQRCCYLHLRSLRYLWSQIGCEAHFSRSASFLCMPDNYSILIGADSRLQCYRIGLASMCRYLMIHRHTSNILHLLTNFILTRRPWSIKCFSFAWRCLFWWIVPYRSQFRVFWRSQLEKLSDRSVRWPTHVARLRFFCRCAFPWHNWYFLVTCSLFPN